MSSSNHSGIERGQSVKDVRGSLSAESRERSSVTGLAYFLVSAVVYATTFAAISVPSGWAARVGLALLNGLAVAMLFVVGHDACHGSLTPHAKLNVWIARLAFLPSLHPYASWEYSHNALHHGWTNLRGKDPVYCPRTIEEFRDLPRWRRWFERASRSWVGLLPLYLVDIWWSLEIAPTAEHRSHIDKRGSFKLDRTLVFLFPLAQAAITLMLLSARGVARDAWVPAVLLVTTLPFLTFNWLIGFATFQHHTHPRILWYSDPARWSFFRSQVQGTVHVIFPRWIELTLHNIMEHTAHHVDTRVPLYNLTDAQAAVEQAYGESNVIVERFSFRGMSNTFRCCQLYDYDRHQWLSFDGIPTTPPRSLEREGLSTEQ
jgi:acyl-lipid omega-6 desaturase (Delta-12 desaturase)